MEARLVHFMCLQRCSLLKYAPCVLYHGPHCTEAHESCIGGGWVWSQNAGWEALKVMGCWLMSCRHQRLLLWIHSASLAFALWVYDGSGSPDNLWIAFNILLFWLISGWSVFSMGVVWRGQNITDRDLDWFSYQTIFRSIGDPDASSMYIGSL